MVERQPGDAALAPLRRVGKEAGEDRRLGRHGAVAEGHRLGVDRGAGGELDQGEVGGPGADRPRRALRKVVHGPGLRHGVAEDATETGIGEDQPGAGPLQQAGGAAQVLFHAAQSRRGVEGHRHGTGQQGAEEAGEEVDAGGEDQGHTVAAPDPQRLHAAGGGEGPVPNLPPAEPGGPLGAVDEAQPAVRPAAGPLQPVEEAAGLFRHRASSAPRPSGRPRSRSPPRPPRRGGRGSGSPPRPPG